MSELLINAEPATPVAIEEANYPNTTSANSYEFVDTVTGDEIFAVVKGGKSVNGDVKLTISETLAASGDANAVLDNDNNCLTINAYSGGSVKVLDMYGNEIAPVDGGYTITLAPMYVICAKPQKTQVIGGDTVVVNGNGAQRNGYVTAVAYKTNVFGNTLAYIDQVKADELGRYNFTFKKNKGDVYEVCVYDGSIYNNKNVATANYDIALKYYVNDQELQSVSAIKAGDKVKIKMNITDNTQKGIDLIAYGAAYDGDMVLLTSDTNVTEWANYQAELTAEVTVPTDGNADSLKFMLWDMNMQPVINKIQSK